MIRLWFQRGLFVVGMSVTAFHAEGATVTVRRGDSLQAALNAAQPGDTLMLEAGRRSLATVCR
jgi:hypothetical protein